jgi:hypothetical protein
LNPGIPWFKWFTEDRASSRGYGFSHGANWNNAFTAATPTHAFNTTKPFVFTTMINLTPGLLASMALSLWLVTRKTSPGARLLAPRLTLSQKQNRNITFYRTN